MKRSRSLQVSSLIVLVVVLATLLAPRAAHAQIKLPLYVLKDGNLWSWNAGQLTQITQQGYVKRPVVSPNEGWVAFRTWAPVAIAPIEQNIFLDQGDFPADMWIMNSATGVIEAIAIQPSAAKLESESFNNAIVRSNPTWSPDSTSIAWTEIALNAYTYRLVIYNLATKQTQVIVDPLPEPLPLDVLDSVRVQWGADGLAMIITRRGEQGIVRELLIFNATGQLLQRIPVDDNFYDFMWIEDNGKAYIGIMNYQKPWVLIDPRSGQVADMVGLPEMFDGAAGASGYSIFVKLDKKGARINGFIWSAVINSSEATRIDFPGETNFAHRITVSPMGLAYVSDAVYVLQAGVPVKIPGTDDIAKGWVDPEAGAITWGPTHWRLRR